MASQVRAGVLKHPEYHARHDTGHMCEAKKQRVIYYLNDDDYDNIFSLIKLLSYLQPTTCKCPLSPTSFQCTPRSVQEAQ